MRHLEICVYIPVNYRSIKPVSDLDRFLSNDTLSYFVTETVPRVFSAPPRQRRPHRNFVLPRGKRGASSSLYQPDCAAPGSAALHRDGPHDRPRHNRFFPSTYTAISDASGGKGPPRG